MALTKISGNVVQQNNFTLSGVVTATSFTGDLTGNVTGTATTATNLADGANITTGTISNDRLPATITKNLTGDVTGNLTGNVTGNVTGTATTATNLADGANITTGTISNDRLPATITKNLTGDVTGNLTGNVSSSGANTLGSLTVTNDATVGGALTITGNLTVNGTTTTIDTVVTAVDSIAVDGDVTAGGNLNVTGVATATTFNGNLTGNVTGNVTGNLTGNLQSTASLAGISSSIADTATAIFVYDTRKDSDGGAWRKRTQHTSWYNETLNTATRGSRREFPAVAVIVAETNQVTIYDGDDPDLPMWMVFNHGGSWLSTSNALTVTAAQVRAVSALNGIIIPVNSGGYGNVEISLISDEIKCRQFNIYLKYSGFISERNNNLGYVSLNASSTTFLINSDVNDVAMTVLPNAPIDDATGLPISTIAVATAGGVSVIKDDGTVVDITETTGPNSVREVTFRKSDGKLGFRYSDSAGNADYLHVGYCPIPSSDKSNSYFYSFSQSTFPGWEDHSYFQAGPDFSDAYPSIMPTGSYSGDGTALIDNNVGTNLGLVRINENPTSPANGMGAYITSDYNTGWMHGDIKGAFLSDTDATNAGSNLVINGNFDSTSNWSLSGTGAFSISFGTLNGDGTAGASFAQQAVSPAVVEQGKTYTVKVTVTHTSGNLYARVANSSYSSNIGSSATHSISLTAGSVPTETILFYSDGWSGTIDNVEVILEDQDRSVNNKGLQVFGTITKSAVATGAELVAYSNWSTSNYLEQPYNSDLNFGTSDFCIMCWVKVTSYSNNEILLSQWNGTDGTGNRFAMYIFNTTGNFGFYQQNGGSSTNTTGSGPVVPQNVWTHLTMIRRSTGISFFVNGEETFISATSRDLSHSSNILTVGVDYNYASPSSNTSMSLLRLSASAPSAEQIKKIYEDEKVLFQENAACTLYGSSDAVTALAYDDSTNLLYAGTSSGRSDFQGLRRINNTTTAVTTAISASNGLVAEQ